MPVHVSVEVPGEAAEVFDWHARPGALSRLLPPWQPVHVVRESPSLRDGTAVLGLPGGVRWVANHDPTGYRPGERFADVLAGPLARMVRWRHSHEFEPAGAGSTLVTDRVVTNLPARFLRSVFAYRQRQLRDDLVSQAWARGLAPEPLTVAITGSSGLVGSALAALLGTGGHRVVRLVRREPAGPGERCWTPDRPAEDLLDGVDALVHLAGAPIGGRFTARHKESVYASRVGPTRRLAELGARHRLTTFVCASAVGFYGAQRGDAPLTEATQRGTGFLADTVSDWESATEPAAEAGSRVVRVRTGIVLTPAGGVLRLLAPLFAAGLGGRLGDGRQWMSWIGLDDLLDVYYRAVVDASLSGPVNAASPSPVRNAEFTRVLARVLRRPALLPVPAAGPRFVLGEEGLRELAMASQRMLPRRLLDIGHRFRRPELEPTLRHVLGRL